MNDMCSIVIWMDKNVQNIKEESVEQQFLTNDELILLQKLREYKHKEDSISKYHC